MTKKVLVDLSALSNVNCGLGVVAQNYGRWFGKNPDLGFEVNLLLPRKYFGAFGDKVKYVECKSICKRFTFLLPKFDLWHATNQLSRFKPCFYSSKYVLTIHDLNFLYEENNEKNIAHQLSKIQRKINHAKRIVAISQYTKRDIEKHLNLRGKRIDVIYSGIEEISSNGEAKPKFPIDESKPFLFSIGQICEKKNFHVLFEAMKLMPQYNLYIAGQKQPGYTKKIEQIIREKYINNAFLVGEISHEEKLWYYNHCRAFVFPSLVEGFGAPIIEAMYFRKPVISSAETSLREVGGKHVFFMENFRPEHIKQVTEVGIAKFDAEPQRAQAEFEYAKTFSYNNHLRQYAKIYQELLAK